MGNSKVGALASLLTVLGTVAGVNLVPEMAQAIATIGVAAAASLPS